VEKIAERDAEERNAAVRPWSSLFIRDFSLIWSALCILIIFSISRAIPQLWQYRSK
jgi:hypothetical protein